MCQLFITEMTYACPMTYDGHELYLTMDYDRNDLYLMVYDGNDLYVPMDYDRNDLYGL